MDIARVSNDVVWRQLRVIFIGSGLLFLINIYFGFSNALTDGDIARSQILIHLHAGSVGWITLSAIGLALWVVTNQRQVDAAYERQVRWLSWAAVLAFAGYIPNFWLAFGGATAVSFLLPIFGSAAVIVLWWAAVFTISQLRRQEPMTTVQLFAAGALLVAAIGATVGALLGLEHVIGRFLPLPDDRVGAHAAMMDTYLFLVAAAIIEVIARPASAQGWSWAGVVQAVAWIVGAALVPIAFFLDAVDAILPIFGMLLLLGLAIFLVRTARRALLLGPVADGVKPWAFFGTAWLVVYMGLFLWAVSTGGDFAGMPSWFFAAFAHAGFVGMMTNLVLAVHLERAYATRQLASWGAPAGLWLLNLGLLAFIGLKFASDIRTGALLMGIGVLLSVGTVLWRLWADDGRATSETPAAEAAAGG